MEAEDSNGRLVHWRIVGRKAKAGGKLQQVGPSAGSGRRSTLIYAGRWFGRCYAWV